METEGRSWWPHQQGRLAS